VLSEDLTVEGCLETSGVLDIRGHVTGTVRADAAVLARDGIVKGSVHARVLTVEGRLRGIASAGSVMVRTAATVHADLATDDLLMEVGADIEGSVSRETATPLEAPAQRGCRLAPSAVSQIQRLTPTSAFFFFTRRSKTWTPSTKLCRRSKIPVSTAPKILTMARIWREWCEHQSLAWALLARLRLSL